MNDILDPPNTAAPARRTVAEGNDERTPLAFHLELQSTQALLSVLATIARLGGRIAFVRAAGTQAVVGLLALPNIAHRVQIVLAQLVEVITVAATVWPAVVDVMDEGF